MNCLTNCSRGICKENPIFVLLLGLCPTLAVTTSIENGIGMGLAATFVLCFSNMIVSLFKNVIPNQIRIPCYVVIIATFVTIVEILIKAYFPDLDRKLGIFIPLIVVNCIILGRAEAFASKNTIIDSMFDGIGMGIGFTLSLVLIGSIREALGSGTLLGINIAEGFKPVLVLSLAPGAFLTMGLLLGFFKYLNKKED